MNKQRIANFIAAQEGFRSKKYLCPAGKYTIGYGHLCTNSTPFRITLSQAEEYLSQDIDVCIASIEGWLYRNNLKDSFHVLSDDQQIALVSFVFNFGIKKFESYHLSSYIFCYIHSLAVLGSPFNTDLLNSICRIWLRYCHIGSERSEGLYLRRQRESNLFSHYEERNN